MFKRISEEIKKNLEPDKGDGAIAPGMYGKDTEDREWRSKRDKRQKRKLEVFKKDPPDFKKLSELIKDTIVPMPTGAEPDKGDGVIYQGVFGKDGEWRGPGKNPAEKIKMLNDLQNKMLKEVR